MKRYSSLLMGILGFVPILAQQSEYYYYYKGERIDLTVDSTHLYVVSEGEFQPQSVSRASTEYSVSKSAKSYVYNNVVPLQKQRATTPEVYFSTLDVPEGTTTSQYEALIAKVGDENNVWQVLPSFTANGKPFDISNNFHVKLKSADDLDKLQEIAAQYGVEIIGNNRFMPLWYTLSCNATSVKNAIETANLFQESQLFACSEPEFCYSMSLYTNESDSELYANDPYYPQQWNLKNTGQEGGIAGIDINVEEAWEITKGNGVVVAVIDQGIYRSHPDLAANMHPESYDVMTGTSPSTIIDNTSEEHGTACAGVIGAVQNNGIGLSGVAPEVDLMSISVDLRVGYFTNQQIADAFNWAWEEGNAHVINCSWVGINKNQYIDEAIDGTLNMGRNGKGCVIVFSSGNEGNSFISYPANYDSRIIVVGGITPMGKRAIGTDELGDGTDVRLNSNYGPHLDIMAPSILVPTTSVYIDEWGFQFDRYMADFSGTSAACPHVAGVAALMLSVNPNLTVQDVGYIIGKTARRVRPDLYSYQRDSVHTYGTWNIEMGYGLVDATVAVKMAQVFPETAYVEYLEVKADEHESYRNSFVEIEHVTVESGGELHIDAEKRAILKSSVRIKKGGCFTIYNVPIQ